MSRVAALDIHGCGSIAHHKSVSSTTFINVGCFRNEFPLHSCSVVDKFKNEDICVRVEMLPTFLMCVNTILSE